MFKVVVVFLSLVGIGFAGIAIGGLEKKPKKFESVEGCYISSLDAVIPFGKSAPAKDSCMEYRCGKASVESITCGSVGASPPCYKVQDDSKPFPECCPTIRCDNRH